jgi:hypothetical protein
LRIDGELPVDPQLGTTIGQYTVFSGFGIPAVSGAVRIQHSG